MSRAESPRSQLLAGFTPVHLLLLVAVADLSIGRLAVPVMQPAANAKSIPTSFVLIDNLGLFLLYFGTMLGVGVLVMRALNLVRARSKDPVITVGRVGLAVLVTGVAGLSAIGVAIGPSRDLSFALQVTWAAAVIAIVIAMFVRRRDLWTAIGVAALAIPLLVHVYAVLLSRMLTEEQVIDRGLVEESGTWGLKAMCLAAMITPYCFAPRPVIRSVTRVAPVVVALILGCVGAILVRREYGASIELASLFTGVDLGAGVPSDDMALYLLALATLGWTLTSCALADAEARRDVGLGVALVILGGYGFVWPFHFVLGIVGLMVIADASPRLADEELGANIRPRTPAIADDAWHGWVTQLTTALRRDDGGEVRAVTARGEDESSTTVILGERNGAPFKLRLGRMGGAVVSLDLVCGREVAETTRATFTLFARPEGTRDSHPPAPPAAPAIVVEDDGFMGRFRARGDAAALDALLDEPLRARAAAMLDGWLAWWQGASLRYRLYPGVGAPMDHPVPLSELAERGAGATDRMVGVIDIVTAIAARGLPAGEPEPEVLAE